MMCIGSAGEPVVTLWWSRRVPLRALAAVRKNGSLNRDYGCNNIVQIQHNDTYRREEEEKANVESKSCGLRRWDGVKCWGGLGSPGYWR